MRSLDTQQRHLIGALPGLDPKADEEGYVLWSEQRKARQTVPLCSIIGNLRKWERLRACTETIGKKAER